ncbi:hypothetical protein [Paraburkholderia saeva]|uniref:hypothetical protein n=1 Tax=Paraburkholderia saeva TaxID=2777537 RepID=UPI001E074EA9|nr:hypothetical protein [Paraburkholderia saeva]CAG4922121.1 hypothetical protein R52603_05037 [Paraburkholderia saeva]CAG4924380.1 hypothetical protein R70241_05258 [Paraburkholderia saeva]
MMYPVVLPGAAVQALSPSLRRSLRLFFLPSRVLYCQKTWLCAWTPVKYAKFFAERYAAQEIAFF